MINIPKKIKISKEAQNIHGINKKDLELAPKSKNVLKDFINKFGVIMLLLDGIYVSIFLSLEKFTLKILLMLIFIR